MFNLKAFVAELIGTFMLVFVGVSAAIVGLISQSLGLGVLLPALATGFAYAVLAYFYGPVSGAHFNPAITFGMALNGAFKWGQAAFYWLAQFIGGILAGFLLSYSFSLLQVTLESGMITGFLLRDQVAGTPAYILALVVEALLTMFLMTTFLRTTSGGRVVNAISGWLIGATLAFAILAGGIFTGAALNPARTFGIAVPLAIMSKDFSLLAGPFVYVVFIFGPLIGATLAMLLNNFFEENDEEILDGEPIPAEQTEEAVGE